MKSNKQLQVVAIKDKKELSKFLNPLYIIDDYMSDVDEYVVFQEKIYNIIKGCFEHKECREYPVKFKFYTNDTEIYTLELRHFVVNIFMWYPFVNLHGIKVLNKNYIVDCINDIPSITNFVNKRIIDTLRDYSIKNIIVNRSVSEVLYNLRRISIDFSIIMNLTFGIEVFLDLYKNNPRMKEIMDVTFPLDMQPSDVETNLNTIMKEEIDILKSMKDNPIGVILRAKTGIKNKQLLEFTSHGGLKPDLSGVTIPLPINNSVLIDGFNKPSSHYLNSLGARKSLIMNNKVMGKAGYFGKVVTLLVRSLSLSKTVSDCETKHYLDITINSKRMLDKYHNRYYLASDNQVRLIDSDVDTDLVGKTIKLRSPITCACKNKDEVCHKCFGTTSLLNLDISDGVSGFESEEITKVVNQSILSAKHLLTTISESIKFNSEFDKFFTITAGEITPIFNGDIEELDDYAVWIDPNSIKKSEELDEDSSSNNYITGSFYVINLVTRECIEIKNEDSEKEMFLTDECLALMRKGKGYVKFKDMTDDMTLFVIVIMNNELTKPLYDIMSLINSSGNTNMPYSDMAQRFTELLLDANINASAVASELIINRLIRKNPDDDFTRPDFSQEDIGEYQIVSVLKALSDNKSALLGLSSQGIKKQLLSDDIVTKKTGTSYLDAFFKTNTSTKRLRGDN